MCVCVCVCVWRERERDSVDLKELYTCKPYKNMAKYDFRETVCVLCCVVLCCVVRVWV